MLPETRLELGREAHFDPSRIVLRFQLDDVEEADLGARIVRGNLCALGSASDQLILSRACEFEPNPRGLGLRDGRDTLATPSEFPAYRGANAEPAKYLEDALLPNT